MVENEERVFIAVYIPANTNDPVEEIRIKQNAGEALSVMSDYCKNHFKQCGPKQLNAKQLQVFKEQVKSHAKGQGVDDSLFGQLANLTSCDIVPLHPNVKELGFMTYNMYVDDKGVAKELPLNIRATSIAAACGLEIQVLGDAFIAKQFDDDDGFRRYDFQLKDLNTDSDWIKSAKKYNLAHKAKSGDHSESNFRSMLNQSNETQEMNELEQVKKTGNDLFAKQCFKEAIETYSKGIERCNVLLESKETKKLKDLLTILYCNRSLAFYKTSHFEESLSDANQCLILNAKSAKALCRKGDALLSLDRVDEAKQAFQFALSIEPSNKDLQSRLNSCN